MKQGDVAYDAQKYLIKMYTFIFNMAEGNIPHRKSYSIKWVDRGKDSCMRGSNILLLHSEQGGDL